MVESCCQRELAFDPNFGMRLSMKLRGVEGGVVVLDHSQLLRDGTVVDVEPVELLGQPGVEVKPPRGSALAVLRHVGIWSAESDEADRLLAALRDAKQAELAAQLDSDNGATPE
jgi:hypothetical protein